MNFYDTRVLLHTVVIIQMVNIIPSIATSLGSLRPVALAVSHNEFLHLS